LGHLVLAKVPLGHIAWGLLFNEESRIFKSMIETMFIGAATGVALSKIADLALRHLKSSPVVQAVSSAMVDLRKHHKLTEAFILGDDATIAFRSIAEELEALEQNGTPFDPKRLATKFRQRGAAPP